MTQTKKESEDLTVEELQAQLEAARAEIEAANAERDSAIAGLDEATKERDEASAELEEAEAKLAVYDSQGNPMGPNYNNPSLTTDDDLQTGVPVEAVDYKTVGYHPHDGDPSVLAAQIAASRA